MGAVAFALNVVLLIVAVACVVTALPNFELAFAALLVVVWCVVNLWGLTSD